MTWFWCEAKKLLYSESSLTSLVRPNLTVPTIHRTVILKFVKCLPRKQPPKHYLSMDGSCSVWFCHLGHNWNENYTDSNNGDEAGQSHISFSPVNSSLRGGEWWRVHNGNLVHLFFLQHLFECLLFAKYSRFWWFIHEQTIDSGGLFMNRPKFMLSWNLHLGQKTSM